MEQKRQDDLIQGLINDLSWDTPTIGYASQKGISSREWDEIVYIMLDKGFMEPSLGGRVGTFSITVKGKHYRNGRYIEEVIKKRQQNELLQQKTDEQEKINREKLSLEIKQLKRNSILSWLSVAISLIALIVGIASYFKPTKSSIEKQYVPVDSHGKTYKSEKVNSI